MARLVRGALSFAVLAAVPPPAAQAQTWATATCRATDVRTPGIDRLAREGVRFTDFQAERDSAK